MQKKYEDLKEDFINGTIEQKIKIYTTADNLTEEQFKDLLNYYPVKHLDKLEKAVVNK